MGASNNRRSRNLFVRCSLDLCLGLPHEVYLDFRIQPLSLSSLLRALAIYLSYMSVCLYVCLHNVH